MAHDPSDLSPAILEFLVEAHLATLTTLRANGSPHVVAVGFGYEPREQVARIITFDGCQKVRNAERMQAAGQRAVVCQVDRGRWLGLEGPVRVVTDPDGVRRGIEAYATRYGQPAERADRVVIEIDVDRVLGRA